MKKLLAMLSLLILYVGCMESKVSAESKIQTNEYLIIFKDKINQELITSYDGVIKDKFTHLPIVKAEFSYDPTEILEKNDGVIKVEHDEDIKGHGVGNTSYNVGENIKPKGLSPLTGKNISVAILDTGIDKEHPDLKVKDGISFVDGYSNFDDDNGHGTHLAGTIGAKNNGIGTTGIAPDVDLYAVKVLDKYMSGKYSTVVKGIDWALEHNIKIVLMSLGGKKESEFFKEAMDKAYEKGILLISSAGNEGYKEGNSITYPAKFSSVIAVGALDRDDKRGFLSSKGDELELMAPGVDILSTWKEGGYRLDSGTSMAAAHAAGIAALIYERKPAMTNKNVRELLNSSAIKMGNPFEYGNGKISISSALRMLESNI